RARETFEDERVRVIVARGREQRIGVETRVEKNALHRAASGIKGRTLPKITSAIRCAVAGGSAAENTRRPTESPAAPARIIPRGPSEKPAGRGMSPGQRRAARPQSFGPRVSPRTRSGPRPRRLRGRLHVPPSRRGL